MRNAAGVSDLPVVLSGMARRRATAHVARYFQDWRIFLAGDIAAIRDAGSRPPFPDEQREYDRLLVAAREQLGEDAFAVAWAEGHTLPLEQAIAEAMGIAALARAD